MTATYWENERQEVRQLRKEAALRIGQYGKDKRGLYPYIPSKDDERKDR